MKGYYSNPSDCRPIALRSRLSIAFEPILNSIYQLSMSYLITNVDSARSMLLVTLPALVLVVSEKFFAARKDLENIRQSLAQIFAVSKLPSNGFYPLFVLLFLASRKEAVKESILRVHYEDTHCSKPQPMNSDAPRVSVKSPMLFLSLINNIIPIFVALLMPMPITLHC